MTFYIILVLLLAIFMMVSITDYGKVPNVNLSGKRTIFFSRSVYQFLFICCIMTFWFLTAFRSSNIGNDTSTYLNYYRIIANNGVGADLSIELGYQYFCLFLSKINFNPYFLLFVCSTLCYTACGVYINKYSKNILYSAILLFCVAFSFFASGLRQAIAMIIVLFAYAKIKKNKKVLPLILILIASLFHFSALCALLWFAHKYIPKKPMIITLVAIVLAFLAASGLLNNVLIKILQEYQNYFHSERAGSGWLGITYYCLRAFVFYLFIYNAYKNNIKENSLTIANSVFLLMTVCLGFSMNQFNRAANYFLLITVVDIPNSFNSGNIKNRDIWMASMGIIMLAYFLVTLIIRPEWNNLYPFEFNWN